MTPVFDYATFQTLITRFAAEAPKALAGHHVVADLATRVEHLLTVAETPFTIAVIGQMRAGKSSLLNALVGADLAIAGVNETTATINWFKHGSKEQEGRFRVEWKDRPAEEFPLVEVQKWIGDSERARATRYLEFYADVPFLRRANIVDTPGTRSVLADHSRAVHEFLALRQDHDTRQAGASADAIIYVLMPVARQTDAELLSDFEKTTRMPGASPYNSLAVVHKWETLECDDPYSEALQKCARIRAALGEMVSLVFPVSAPLAAAAERFDPAFWSGMLSLAANTPADILDDLLLQEKDFVGIEERNCPLDVSARQRLRREYKLPWPSFKMVLKAARKARPGSPADLKAEVMRVSGLNQLREALDSRFLTRSGVIKAFSILSKAWEPCQIASARLRNYKNRFQRLLQEAQQASAALGEVIAAGATQLEPVLHFVQESRHTVEHDLRQVGETLHHLGEVVLTIKDAYDDMDADLHMLELVEQRQSELDPDWVRKLRSLFGYHGPRLADRLRSLATDGTVAATVDDVEQTISAVRKQMARTQGEVRKLFEHALQRLGQLADVLENSDPTTLSAEASGG